MNRSVSVQIMTKAGNIMEYVLIHSTSRPWTLQLGREDLSDRTFEGNDLFECMTKLRGELEKQQERLLCNGARRDVYPSGMLRDMGGGGKAYILQPDKQELPMVNIFEPGLASEVDTVEAQRLFYQKWLERFK